MALVLAVGLMVLFAALFAPFGMGYGMMGGGWGWGMAVFMVVPGILLILVLLAALGAFTERPAYPGYVPPPSALEILDARYARGEITKDEYEDMKRVLSADEAPGRR